MPFSPVTLDRERDKFVESPAGETSVRVLVSNESTDPVLVSGLSAIAAPTGPLKRSVVTVTDTAADPIPTPLTNRVALSLRNKSTTATVYLGEDNTITPDNTATGGWEIGPGEDFSLDLNENNGFFLRTAVGETAIIKILEIASLASASTGGITLTGTMTQEVPGGTIDGSNTAFTIGNTPISSSYFTLYVNGVYQRLGQDYTRTGINITMIVAPSVGQQLDAVYWY